MKRFTEYLIESKQTYTFKIKVAGDCPDNADEHIKHALISFEPEKCSKGNRAPIQQAKSDRSHVVL